MTSPGTQYAPHRLRSAAFAPIGDEGRVELVKERLVQAISTGAFTEGDRLPSELELSQRLGVAVDTVREALGQLRRLSLIETRRGRSGGSFVSTSAGAVESFNRRALAEMPRVALADLGVLYEVVSAACAEFACLRATHDELEVVHRIVNEAEGLPRRSWRQRITGAQLELAALSQSVGLTAEHVRLQTRFTPLLALQDADEDQRGRTHSQLLRQIELTMDGDADGARQLVREGVRGSVRWLVEYRARLLNPAPDGPGRATLVEGEGG